MPWPVPPSAAALLDTGVMPGHDAVAAEDERPFHELFKLHIAVAVYAGVWRQAMSVGLGEASYDLFVEGLREVEHIIPDTQPAGDGSRILDVLESAAGVSAAQTDIPVVIPLEPSVRTISAP